MTVRRADGSTVEAPMEWFYFKDWVSPQPFVADRDRGGLPLEWTMTMLAGQPPAADGRGNIGNRDGFLPALGEVLWEAPAENSFRAYIYRSPADGRKIGFVRVPSFVVRDPDKSVADFAALVKRFETETDALVVDETNNPGGYVFYMYALASMLTDKPLPLPMYRINMTQGDAMQTALLVRRAERAGVKTEEDAAKFFGKPSLTGYPADLALFNGQLSFYREYLESWEAGDRISRPLYLFGIKELPPHGTVRYTKPLVVLTNELDISCGDFFPAMLQDGGRAVVFGERTAGAGGSVNSVEYPPNLLGISSLSLTGSFAVRPNGQPLENLGVTPDIPYLTTPEDVQGGYRGYAAALNAALSGLAR
jgi:catechol 2,3-dioxygenase-like lactoylglutathione lyase family enzyme